VSQLFVANRMQFPEEYLQQDILRFMQEEMVARQHSQFEIFGGLLAPTFHMLASYVCVLESAKRRDPTIQWFFRFMLVGLTDRKICFQHRQQKLDQLEMFECRRQRAVQFAQSLDEVFLRQIVDDPVLPRSRWSPAAGDEDVPW
jgi:hypothetical protein